MAKKKSYNPFKMWGAWVGTIIAIPYSILIMLNLWMHENLILFLTPQNVIYDLINDLILRLLNITPKFEYLFWGLSLWVIITLLFGFLLGWGIHSLVRRFRK